MSAILHGIAGGVTGILTGFGIGGGTLLILYMITFTGFSQTAAQGINLLYFLPTAGGSLISHIKNRLIDLRAFCFAASAGTVCTILAANLAGALPVGLIRRLFGIFLIVIGICEFFRKST